MKTYRRQLNSLKELREEKKRLAASIDSFVPFSKEEDKHERNNIASDNEGDSGLDIPALLMNILSNDIVSGMLVRLGLPMMKKAGKFTATNLFSIGKEVFGGYLKWKAMEVTYRWARRYMNKKQERKATQHY